MTHKVLYIGLDIKSLFLLKECPDLQLVGSILIDDIRRCSLNPANFVFSYFYKCQESNKLHHHIHFFIAEVLLAVTRPFLTGTHKKYAEYISYHVRHDIKVFSLEDDLESLQLINIDLIVVNVWDMLSTEVLRLARRGALNIHPSKLPQYRGAVPTLYSLKNRDPLSAVSYMILDEKLDRGGIIGQYDFQIHDTDNWYTVEQKIQEIVIATLVPTILDYLNNKLTPQPQDTKLASYTATHESYRVIDANSESMNDIYNKVWLYPYLEPGIYCYLLLNDRRVQLKRVFYEHNSANDLAAGVHVRFLVVYITTTDGNLSARLFVDINFFDSVYLLFSKLSNVILGRNNTY